MHDHVHGAQQANLEASSFIKLPTRVITYAWGDLYIEDLLSLTIPALLAPGNLPYLASQVSCEVIILTEERFFARVGGHPAIARLRAICPLRLIGLDDLITAPDKKYGMALTYALHRGFADLGPAVTDSWQVFLNADFILADGSLRNLLYHLRRGQRIVASPSYCVVAKAVAPELLKRVDSKTSTLSMSPREMAKLALPHRHNTIRGKTVNQRALHIHYMEQFYWLVDEDTLLGHQMPIAIVGMRPQAHVKEPNSYWDHGLMKEFCPTAEPYVIGDSDEFLMIELREKDVAQDQLLPGWPEARALGERMISWVTPYQRDFARYPLTLHAADLPANMDEGRRKLRAFVDEVLSYVPAQLPSHLDHPQWNYHWTGFVAARHQYLSSRLGSLTETTEPPPYLSQLDQTWWKFDGAQKSLTRRRAELLDVMSRRLALIQDAIQNAEHGFEQDGTKLGHELDRQIVAEFLRAQTGERAQSTELFARVSLDQDGGAGSIGEPESRISPSDHWASILKRHEQKYADLREQVRPKVERLQQALEAVSSYYRERICALDHEFERAKAEYVRLTSKPPGSSTTAFLRMRQGPATLNRQVTGSTAGQIARKLYYLLLGRWPRVTRLNPYHGALRHLHRLIERAIARGAKDVLIVGDRSRFADTLANLSGLHALTSVTGVKAGSDSTVVQRHQFDLCICDLDFEDFSKFSEIYVAARRFMRPGGTIIGFHSNFDGVPLPINNYELEDRLRGIPIARIYYGRSAKLLKAFRSALSARRSFSVVVLGKLALKMGLLALLAGIRNVLGAPFSRIRQSVAPARASSITIEITLPEFEGDDGTVEYAKAAGIYIDGIEAPVADQQSVAPSVANPRGATVILTFGQSNAANSGEERYAARGAVHVFNMFDGRFYHATDPLPGASTDGGSVWGRLGDKLIDAGICRSVLFVPTAFGGTYVKDWAPGGQCYRRLMFALHRLKGAGLEVDMLCWHQGEADANHTELSADEYCSHFRSMLRGLRQAGVKAPVYVAVATLCEDAPHPFQNGAQIRRAQQQLASAWKGVLPGPDTDRIGIEHRRDRCHFAASGQELAAAAWFKAIASGRLVRLVRSAKYRLGRMFASN